MEALQEWFISSFENASWLAVLLFAMLPIAEARLAIPFGISLTLAKTTLSLPAVFISAFVGSLVPCFFLILFLKPIFNWLKTKGMLKNIINKFENSFLKKAETLDKNDKLFSKGLALTLFVGVPLPITGVWTGSAVGAFSSLKYWQAALCVGVGNFLACIIIMLLCLFFKNSILFVFIIFIAVIFIYLLFLLILNIIKINKRKKLKNIEK